MRRTDGPAGRLVYAGFFAGAVAFCAAVSWAMNVDVRALPPNQFGVLIGAALILAGVLILLGIGPLAPSLERAGLGKPRTPAARRVSTAFYFVTFGGLWLIGGLAGPRPGFWLPFLWLLVTLTGFTVLYRRAQHPGETSLTVPA